MKHIQRIAALALAGVLCVAQSGGAASTPDKAALKKKADEVCALKDNVSARHAVSAVLEYVDLLLKEGDKTEVLPYLQFALKVHPWALDYQLQYAVLLKENGDKEKADEKARLVLDQAENQELIDRAAVFLGQEKEPAIPPMNKLEGTAWTLVLVPVGPHDPWLLRALQKELASILTVPVQVQSVPVDIPPATRDMASRMLADVRTRLLENMEDPGLKQAMTDLNVKPEDLKDAEVCRRVFRVVLRRSPDASRTADFDKTLSEATGKLPQWEADLLRGNLFKAVAPYRRPNVIYVGVTALDIYSGKDNNFLFGLANSSGAIASYRRFTADFNEDPPSRFLLVQRTLKQVLSSTGFVMGVGRCTSPTCARAYPNSLREHDAKQCKLCTECAQEFEKVLRK